jgi:DNA-binding transcriptional MerR regulator
MTIGQLSDKSGVPATTLRYWERIGVLPKTMRVSGQRRYQPEAVDLVAVLRLAKACGFSLVEMRRLLSGFRLETSASERWRTSIRDHQELLERQIAQLNAMQQLLQQVQQCQCADLIECGRIASSLNELKSSKTTSQSSKKGDAVIERSSHDGMTSAVAKQNKPHKKNIRSK